MVPWALRPRQGGAGATQGVRAPRCGASSLHSSSPPTLLQLIEDKKRLGEKCAAVAAELKQGAQRHKEREAQLQEQQELVSPGRSPCTTGLRGTSLASKHSHGSVMGSQEGTGTASPARPWSALLPHLGGGWAESLSPAPHSSAHCLFPCR